MCVVKVIYSVLFTCILVYVVTRESATMLLLHSQ